MWMGEREETVLFLLGLSYQERTSHNKGTVKILKMGIFSLSVSLVRLYSQFPNGFPRTLPHLPIQSLYRDEVYLAKIAAQCKPCYVTCEEISPIF